jgi:hypothetical protein
MNSTFSAIFFGILSFDISVFDKSVDPSEASSEDVYSAKTLLQLASLFGKIWEEFSTENVTKAFKVNQRNHNI